MKNEPTHSAPPAPTPRSRSYKDEPDGLAMRTYPGGVHWTRADDGSYNLNWGALGVSGSGPTDAGAIARRIHARAGSDRDRVDARLKTLGWWDVLAHLLAIDLDLQTNAQASRLAELQAHLHSTDATGDEALNAFDLALQEHSPPGPDLREVVRLALGTPEEPEDGDCRFPLE